MTGKDLSQGTPLAERANSSGAENTSLRQRKNVMGRWGAEGPSGWIGVLVGLPLIPRGSR